MPTTISPAFRPLTASLSPAVLDLIRCAVPVHTEEHLVQGWDALSVAGDTEDGSVFVRNMAFARTRLAHAREALGRMRPSRKARAAAAEVAHFERLIGLTR